MRVASPPREESFQAEVRRHLRRNYLAHLSHGLLGQTGMRLVNAPTFLPAYVAALTGSDLAVGVARGLQYLGMFLSPVVGATVIEHRRRVLPVGFAIGALMRVQILGLALGGLLLPPPFPTSNSKRGTPGLAHRNGAMGGVANPGVWTMRMLAVYGAGKSKRRASQGRRMRSPA